MGAGGRAPNGQQIKQMLEAFLDAFDRDELKEVVLLEMNERLDTIVADNNLRTTVFELIMWAKRQGRVGELINAAAGNKPNKALMAALANDAASWGLEAPIVRPPAGAGAPVAGAPPPSQPTVPPAPQDNGPQLTVNLALKMAYVPSAVMHLLDPNLYPLAQVQVVNSANRPRRVSVATEVEDFSYAARNTIDLGPAGSANATAVILQRPVFIRNQLKGINEQLQANMHVRVKDLESDRELLDEAKQVWMLAINSAPVRVKDEATGNYQNMVRYLAAFVTENEPTIQDYLKVVASYHPKKQLGGYYAADSAGDSVRSQVRALSAALQQEGKLNYAPALVNAVADSEYQRVRLPRESLRIGLANCLEGVLLYCSLLEAMGLQAALVWAREHAIVGWKESGTAQKWTYLDTTKVAQFGFDSAMRHGDAFVDDNSGRSEDEFGILAIRDLRKQGITPLE